MKALKIILIIVVVLVVIIAVLGIIAPNDYHVERTVTIEAPHDVIHAQVTSLKNRQEWSPWADRDLNMTVTYEGTDGEVGSVSKWEGDKNVGKGMQEITAITDNRVESKLTFIEPWESVSYGYIELNPTEESIDVTWGFDGSNAFPMNIMGLFMDMDNMIGKDFEKGLAMLKTRSEQLAAKQTSNTGSYEVIETQWPAKKFIIKREEVPFDQIGQYFQTNMPELHQALIAANLEMTGAPCGLYYSWDENNQITDMAVAIPVADNSEAPEGFESATVDQSKALMIAYYGAYDKVEDAHYSIIDYIQVSGDSLNGLVIEEYFTDPAEQPDTSQWLTNIYYLIK